LGIKESMTEDVQKITNTGGNKILDLINTDD
jgi:hypothetical protein